MRKALLLSLLLATPVAAQEDASVYPWNVLLAIPKPKVTAKEKVAELKPGVFTLRDAQLIAEQCEPAVVGVAPIIRGRGVVSVHGKSWVPLYVYGTTPSFRDVRGWQEMQEGAPFTAADVRKASRVCVLGQSVARELFGEESPVGKVIATSSAPLHRFGLKVVGVLGKRGFDFLGLDQDDIVIVPWTTMQVLIAGGSLSSPGQTLAKANKSVLTMPPLPPYAGSDFKPPLAPPISPYPGSGAKLYPGSSASLYPGAPDSLNPMLDTVDATMVTQNPLFARFDLIEMRVEKKADRAAVMNHVAAILRQSHKIRPGQPADFTVRDLGAVAKALLGRE